MIIKNYWQDLERLESNIMNEKQIEALRVWACEVTHVVSRLAKDNGMVICAETVVEVMNNLDAELQKQPDEGF